MNKNNLKVLLVISLAFGFSLNTSADFNVDSFFDIHYEISVDRDPGTPSIKATLPDGTDVPLRAYRGIKFFNESKGFSHRILVQQNLGQEEYVLISADCSNNRCVITDIEQKSPDHRGHVTVLK